MLMEDRAQKTDAELVVATLNDADAFLFLVERYEKRLLRYICRFSRLPHEEAEEILQEVFIKVYRNLNGFDASLSFSSWIYRIAHNETVNHLKGMKKNNTIRLETDDADGLQLIDLLESELSAMDETLQNELRDRIQSILSHLSADYREVLVLRFLEDKSYEEIGDILKKPMGTVATLINRAKSQFKQLVEKNDLTLSFLPS